MEIVIIISALARQLKCKSLRTNACTRHEEAPSLILQVEWLCSFSTANHSDIVSTLIHHIVLIKNDCLEDLPRNGFHSGHTLVFDDGTVVPTQVVGHGR